MLTNTQTCTQGSLVADYAQQPLCSVTRVRDYETFRSSQLFFFVCVSCSGRPRLSPQCVSA